MSRESDGDFRFGLDALMRFRARCLPGLLQIFVKCENHNEAAAYEVAVRDMIYLIKQDAVQPDFWLEMSKGGDVAACKAKLALP